jgi:hypothetical protein
MAVSKLESKMPTMKELVQRREMLKREGKRIKMAERFYSAGTAVSGAVTETAKVAGMAVVAILLAPFCVSGCSNSGKTNSGKTKTQAELTDTERKALKQLIQAAYTASANPNFLRQRVFFGESKDTAEFITSNDLSATIIAGELVNENTLYKELETVTVTFNDGGKRKTMTLISYKKDVSEKRVYEKWQGEESHSIFLLKITPTTVSIKED